MGTLLTLMMIAAVAIIVVLLWPYLGHWEDDGVETFGEFLSGVWGRASDEWEKKKGTSPWRDA
jgi:hypothetical protein